MRAAIYNPYLDTLGGGERYTLSFAKVLTDLGWQTDLEWKDLGILKSLSERFGMDLSGINIVEDVKKGDGYDLCFWVSDGSVPLLHGRNNILHFQVPFHNVGGKSLLNKMKFFRINKIVCNSRFTKEIIDKEYGVDSIVIYPPVGIENIKPKRKENIILYVGRFSKILQSKRQDVLIKAFKKIYNNGFSDWKLILAGGAEVGNDGCVDELEKLSENYPIEILVSPSYKELKDLYGKAKFFWSAAGFEENETKNPEKVEHFGITVVEAMAGGAVPVVYNAGGYKEVVENGKTGFLWNRTSELTRFTTSLAEDPKSFREMQVHIKERAKKYDYNIFKERIKEILK